MSYRLPFLRAFSVVASLGITTFPCDVRGEAPLPDPDGKPADVSKPVQVFIIMGQSNTLEFGKVKGDKEGSLLSLIHI